MSFFPFVPVSGTPAVPSYVTISNSKSTAGAVVTYTGISIGTANANRYVIVGYGGGEGGGTLVSATINGVNATKTVSADTGNGSVGFIIAKVPTGTSGSVVLTFTNSLSSGRGAIIVWTVTNLVSATASSTATDTTATANAYDGTLVIPADGFGLGVVYQGDNGLRTFTWTNLTEDVDSNFGGPSVSGASSTTAGSALRTATSSGSIQGGLALAAWR